jgi:glycosyltransferase involved in cell wall biosynthesis
MNGGGAYHEAGITGGGLALPQRRPAAAGGAGHLPAAVVESEATTTGAPVVSVVMPCLNEEASIAACVGQAHAGLRACGLSGEVIVVDNGSTDGSVARARATGARVVHEPARGYGNAYLRGFAVARGRYIVMGDADGTYDFRELGRFVAPLQQGSDLVIGNRFGGAILPGAMPWLNQYIGNPLLSRLLQLLFRVSVTDAHCGMRSFTATALAAMHLQASGMEFASEMIIAAARAGLRIAEVPITYYPRCGESKLRRMRDGWRHLRFMLLYSPDYLFLVPGIFFFMLGWLLLSVLLRGPLHIGSMALVEHPMIVGSLLVLTSAQVSSFGFCAKLYAVAHGYLVEDPLVSRLSRLLTLERGIALGVLLVVLGLAIDMTIVREWTASGFAALGRMREAVLAQTLIMLGVQVVFTAFFASILAIPGHSRPQFHRRVRVLRRARTHGYGPAPQRAQGEC